MLQKLSDSWFFTCFKVWNQVVEVKNTSSGEIQMEVFTWLRQNVQSVSFQGPEGGPLLHFSPCYALIRLILKAYTHDWLERLFWSEIVVFVLLQQEIDVRWRRRWELLSFGLFVQCLGLGAAERPQQPSFETLHWSVSGLWRGLSWLGNATEQDISIAMSQCFQPTDGQFSRKLMFALIFGCGVDK